MPLSIVDIMNFTNYFSVLSLNYRKCCIDEHNSLIYQEVNHTIFLITIIDNRSLHNY